jgi:hypothetical protein
LLSAGVIEKCFVKKDDSQQKELWIIYAPPYTITSTFEKDYHNIQIDKYTPDMTFEQKLIKSNSRRKKGFNIAHIVTSLYDATFIYLK